VARSATIFACSSCGHESPKWHGRCPGCGDWNTLVEERAVSAPRGGTLGGKRSAKAATPVPLREVEAAQVARIGTGIAELDRVLGGGMVPGSLVLIGGSPGIGKSTLTLAALANISAGRLAAGSNGASGSGPSAESAASSVLYVTGEESAAQVRLRAERISADALNVPIVAETDVSVVEATLEAERPAVCVIDSVQTLHDPALSSAAGSVAQVREATARLMRVAKQRRIALFIVGHVTKDGTLAGPRVMEHLVDCVLHFEGERERTYRTVRALKNRFGSTNEVGVFEMREDGLIEVPDASARFVGEATRAPGSVVLCAMEGSRPLLVEVQALVAPSEIVPPRRVANGIDRNRLALVLAVLGRQARIAVGSADVFVSVAGGVRVDEPGADLAVALAIASAARGVPLGDGVKPLAVFGEVGLTGEIRHVAHPDRRLAEARKFGLDSVIGPELKTVKAATRAALRPTADMHDAPPDPDAAATIRRQPVST
jgi:DNA repair protein RadA/Sms